MNRNNWTLSEIREIYNTPLLDLIYRAATVHRQQIMRLVKFRFVPYCRSRRAAAPRTAPIVPRLPGILLVLKYRL